jgi:multidrug resistance protein, MATE family
VIGYKDIMKLSLPIMIGSAVQNVITLTDTYFLARYNDNGISFAAIGIVGIFYLMITTIGYNFTKAGQIIIARRMGEGKQATIGTITYSMWGFILILSAVFFVVTKFVTPLIFPLLIHDPAILQASDDYLQARGWGIFFSYSGMVAIALYTGVARPMVIIYNAVMLGVINAVLNYGLIFGNWGFPELGMAGAAWASSISEVCAFLMFFLYMLFDKNNRIFGFFGAKLAAQAQAERDSLLDEPIIMLSPPIEPTKFFDWTIVKNQIALSTPIIFQSVVGIGSWLIFFFLIENMGREALEISTLLRSVYMMFMIPSWGFGSGINTIVSNLIGKNQRDSVMRVINRTALLCFSITMICMVVLLIAPHWIFGIIATNSAIIEGAVPMLGVFGLILAFFSTGAIYFNGIIGTGATYQSLVMQVTASVFYLIYAVLVTKVFQVSLSVAWGGEALYWIITLVLAIWYLRSNRWASISV